MTRIVLAYPAHDRPVDGIRDYAEHLVAQLGDDATLLRPPRGMRLAGSLLRALPRGAPAVLIVQYNPFAWGRWGIAPSLPLSLGFVRLVRPRTRVVAAFHEAWVPIRDVRSALIGGWQRAQVRALLSLCHRSFAMTEDLARVLSRVWPRRTVGHVPVGSNLPDRRSQREETRVSAGYADHLVLATFANGHETHLGQHVVRATAAVVAASDRPVALLLLGSGNHLSGSLPPDALVLAPGFLEADRLAEALSGADLFLAPFLDGASTRRTTLMASFQHALPTLTTVTARTDRVLRDADAVDATPADDIDAFVARAVALSVSASDRARLARGGRGLFEREFSWPAICGKLRDLLATTD
jgi:glycosyltransferase involved in cell wall biosynthesis